MQIDTMNFAMVGVQGPLVIVLNPIVHRGMTKAECLNLAAYLVTLSGAEREEFEAVLTAIENT